MNSAAVNFVKNHTLLEDVPLVPDIRLYLAREITPIWQATEVWFGAANIPPPFWAFVWPGSLALAAHMFANPELVRGKRILDFASGCGLGAIAAMKCGASFSQAADIDPLAQAAAQINASQNRVVVENRRNVDLTQAIKDVDMIMAGDVCYEQGMSVRVLRWLRLCAQAGVEVLLADPERAYAPDAADPESGLREVASYDVPVLRELEDRDVRHVTIWQLFCGGSRS